MTKRDKSREATAQPSQINHIQTGLGKSSIAPAVVPMPRSRSFGSRSIAPGQRNVVISANGPEPSLGAGI
jgi:hypothetical protein